MARRRPMGHESVAKGMLRSLLLEGKDIDEATGSVSGALPYVDPREVRRLARDVVGDLESVRRVLIRDLSERVNLALITKCGLTPKEVRVGLATTVYHAGGEDTKRFGAEVTIPSRGKLEDLLMTAVQKVLDAAVARGYEHGNLDDYRPGAANQIAVDFYYFECI